MRENGEVVEDPSSAAPTAADADAPTEHSAAEWLRLEATLVEAEEENRERRVAMQVIRNELARTREDLEAAREQHAADGERFRENLARVRRSAEDVVAAAEAARMRAEEEAQELRSELEDLRQQVVTASRDLAGVRAAIEEARGVAGDLVARLAATEHGSARTDDVPM